MREGWGSPAWRVTRELAREARSVGVANVAGCIPADGGNPPAHELRNPRVQPSLVRLELSGFHETGDVVGCRPAHRACPRSHRAVRALGPSGASGRRGTHGTFERPPRSAAGLRIPHVTTGGRRRPAGRPEGAEGLHSPVRARASATRRAATHAWAATHDVTRFMKPRQFKANERRLDARVAQLVGGTQRFRKRDKAVRGGR